MRDRARPRCARARVEAAGQRAAARARRRRLGQRRRLVARPQRCGRGCWDGVRTRRRAVAPIPLALGARTRIHAWPARNGTRAALCVAWRAGRGCCGRPLSATGGPARCSRGRTCMSTFSAAAAAPGHQLVRLLGSVFDRVTAKPHKLQPVANVWAGFAGSAVTTSVSVSVSPTATHCRWRRRRPCRRPMAPTLHLLLAPAAGTRAARQQALGGVGPWPWQSPALRHPRP